MRMTSWYMLTIVGTDRSGIVAKVTDALYRAGCNLGEASMIRLGGNFTIMLMVTHAELEPALTETLNPVIDSLGLCMHIDQIEGHLHQHVVPNVRIAVHGADRAGIIAQVTAVLAEEGLNITDLESNVAGSDNQPIYIMHLEGFVDHSVDALQMLLNNRVGSDIKVTVSSLDTLYG